MKGYMNKLHQYKIKLHAKAKDAVEEINQLAIEMHEDMESDGYAWSTVVNDMCRGWIWGGHFRPILKDLYECDFDTNKYYKMLEEKARKDMEPPPPTTPTFGLGGGVSGGAVESDEEEVQRPERLSSGIQWFDCQADSIAEAVSQYDEEHPAEELQDVAVFPGIGNQRYRVRLLAKNPSTDVEDGAIAIRISGRLYIEQKSAL